jgi:hypothetical protein
MGILDDFGWEEMAVAGSLAEEMAEEERERRRIERELCREEDELDKDDEEPFPRRRRPTAAPGAP